MLFPIHDRKNTFNWGYIDERGNVVIEPQFERAAPFSDGLAWVRLQDRGEPMHHNHNVAFIDETGRLAFGQRFWFASDFSEGLAAVQLWADDADAALCGCIDKRGQMVIEQRKVEFLEFSEGRAAVYARIGDDQKWGIVDRTGAFVLPLEYDDTNSFSGRLAAVKPLGRDYGFVDRDGNWILEPQFQGVTDFEDGVAGVFVEGEGGFIIDRAGERLARLPSGYDFTEYASEGLFCVIRGERCGFADLKGNIVTEAIYTDSFYHFSEGLCAVETDDGKWGYIDRAGEMVIPPRFRSADDFRGGLAGVNHCGEYINRFGDVVWRL